VESAKKEIEMELEKAKAELRLLEGAKKRGFVLLPKLSSRSMETQTQDFRGLIVPHMVVTGLQLESRAKAVEAGARFVLQDVPARCNHIAGMPGMQTVVAEHDRILDPMYAAVRQWKHVVHQKGMRLAVEYAERREEWMKFCTALDGYAEEARETVPEWPPEFAKTTSRPHLEMADAGASPMYLDGIEAVNFCMWDGNNFVEDPVKEHDAFRKRLYWSEAEVKMFLEKYSQYPKDFKRISMALPNKSVKDVIEFYFIKRIELGLKDIEVAARKRGRKKMLVARGAGDK
jgi:hypothetical protein